MAESEKPTVVLAQADRSTFGLVKTCGKATRALGWTEKARTAFVDALFATTTFEAALGIASEHFSVESE